MTKKGGDRKKKIKKSSSKSNFLLQTYKMIENESDGGLIKWGPRGESFVIENNEAFVKILP